MTPPAPASRIQSRSPATSPPDASAPTTSAAFAREGMIIDSVQQEPHSPVERRSLFFTNDPVRAPVAQGPMLG